MSKFKVGDNVELPNGEKETVVEVMGKQELTDLGWYSADELELVKPIKIGDVIIDYGKGVKGSEQEVLEVLDNVFLISTWDNYACADTWWTFIELEKMLKSGEWKIKGKDEEIGIKCPYCKERFFKGYTK